METGRTRATELIRGAETKPNSTDNSLEYEVEELGHLLWHFRASLGDAVYAVCRAERHLWKEQQRHFHETSSGMNNTGGSEAERWAVKTLKVLIDQDRMAVLTGSCASAAPPAPPALQQTTFTHSPLADR